MRINHPVRLFFLVSLLFIGFGINSCEYQRLLKSDDYEKKLEAAIEYYEDERYSRSISLLNSVLPIYRGTQKAETVNYYYAMAHYKQRDYIYAAHLFRSFYQGFPNSEHAEEFFFLSAYCKYLMSPRHSLDQTPTREAIQQFQRFINKYPNSEKVEVANEFIDELRLKLERKAFEIAKLYYDLTNYNAAATAFKALNTDYPDNQYREEALFLILESYFLFAENSIPQRQKERYQKAVDAYYRFIRVYPESELSGKAKRMYEESVTKINELASIE